MINIERTKQDYLNLLQETVDYYSEDTSRRAVDWKGRCLYFNKGTGDKCAVGRCLSNPKQVQEEHGAIAVINDILIYLKPKYMGYSKLFWCDLQNLHDDEDCWDNDGLTPYGKAERERIENNIEYDRYESNN